MPDVPVVDFHSHILPHMDDGSASLEMSLAMLRTSRAAGVDIMVSTSHYYKRNEEIDAFLERRTKRLEELLPCLDSTCCGVVPGAEVAFYFGMDEDPRLGALCVGDTRAILVEMPFQSWGTYEINTLSSLCYDRRLTVILAHYERFAEFQKGNRVYEEVLELPLYVQINAGSLTGGWHSRQWLKMFKKGSAHILGSDCHNTESRPPDLDRGRDVIRKKLGEDVLHRIDRNAAALLLGLKPGRGDA